MLHAMPVARLCPVHRSPLDAHGERALACRDHGETYPVVDGIPILLPDATERGRVAGTDWAGRATSDAVSSIDFYNQTRDHEQYSSSDRPDERDRIARWLEATEPSGPSLEIGSGMGAFQGLGGEYVALDYSLTLLQRYIAPTHDRVCGTAERLPFADDTFRFVFTVAALEHVPEADRAFGEIARVLKPGGVAYLGPAWHCVQYNCEGIPVRPYRDLDLRQKFVKLTLPVRRNLVVKALGTLPGRLARRALYEIRPAPTQMRFERLRPDYERFWTSDSDAAARLDSHEACLYFHSRGYRVLAPGPGIREQLAARHGAVIVQKPARA
jgi:SAM-dependent methyltransferase